MKKCYLTLCVALLSASSAIAGGEAVPNATGPTEEVHGSTVIKRDKDGNGRGVLVGDRFDFPQQKTDVELAEAAIQANDADGLHKLLKRGLDPNSTQSMFPKGSSEATLLYAALCKPELVKILLEAGANPHLTRSTVLGSHTFYGYLEALEDFSAQRANSADGARYRENLLCIEKARAALKAHDKTKGSKNAH